MALTDYVLSPLGKGALAIGAVLALTYFVETNNLTKLKRHNALPAQIQPYDFIKDGVLNAQELELMLKYYQPRTNSSNRTVL